MVIGNQPSGGWIGRGLAALVLLLFIALGAHLAYEWLSPLVPVVCVVIVLGVVFRLVLGRRR